MPTVGKSKFLWERFQFKDSRLGVSVGVGWKRTINSLKLSFAVPSEELFRIKFGGVRLLVSRASRFGTERLSASSCCAVYRSLHVNSCQIFASFHFRPLPLIEFEKIESVALSFAFSLRVASTHY